MGITGNKKAANSHCKWVITSLGHIPHQYPVQPIIFDVSNQISSKQGTFFMLIIKGKH